MMSRLRRFVRHETGATAIEYGLIAALISITVIASATFIGTNLSAKLGAMATSIGSSVP
jgi:pilus assembly protein Flp/PilA